MYMYCGRLVAMVRHSPSRIHKTVLRVQTLYTLETHGTTNNIAERSEAIRIATYGQSMFVCIICICKSPSRFGLCDSYKAQHAVN